MIFCEGATYIGYKKHVERQTHAPKQKELICQPGHSAQRHTLCILDYQKNESKSTYRYYNVKEYTWNIVPQYSHKGIQ